jgi:hypothetical protein
MQMRVEVAGGGGVRAGGGVDVMIELLLSHFTHDG